VQVKLEGDKFQFDVSADGSVLLEAARKAGLEAPFSCKTGICGSCRAKIKNGTVSMKANYALTAEEVEQGYILTCQAQPTCSDLSISFDD
ncbi:MAG: 2Fe-2S iron-sulfur cluster-binding protein, partial [Flavobacteriia bacterium]